MQYRKSSFYESIDFQFAKARILARYSGYDLRKLKEQSDKILLKHPNDAGALYLKTLVLIGLNNYKLAHETLLKLEAKYHNNLFYIDTMSDILIAQKKYQEIEKFLLNAQNKLGMNNEVVAANLATAYIEMKQFDKAINVVRRCQMTKKFSLGNELLLKSYKNSRRTCDLYLTNIKINENKGHWDLAMHNANEALRTCESKDEILKIRAWIGKIAEKRDFYEKLLKQ